MLRAAPCPPGQQIDMLDRCRPVVRGGGAPPPLPELILAEYSRSYGDYDPFAPRDRPTRLARLGNSVVAPRQTGHDERHFRT